MTSFTAQRSSYKNQWRSKFNNNFLISLILWRSTNSLIIHFLIWMKETKSLSRWNTFLKNKNVLQILSAKKSLISLIKSKLIIESALSTHWLFCLASKKLCINKSQIATKTFKMQMKHLSLSCFLQSAWRHSAFFVSAIQTNLLKFSFTTFSLSTRHAIMWSCTSSSTSWMTKSLVLNSDVRRLLSFFMDICTSWAMLHGSIAMISFANCTVRSNPKC